MRAVKEVNQSNKDNNIAAVGIKNGEYESNSDESASVPKESSPTDEYDTEQVKSEGTDKEKLLPKEEEKPYTPTDSVKHAEPDIAKISSLLTNRNSDSALSRIESLLDDEFEEAMDTYNEDLIEEIMRKCDHFEGRPLPQNLVKSVVSLTTPKDVLSTTPLEPPSFVEFSMAEDGFGCLFIPSLNPQPISSKI